jgi:hypothetical protein
MQRYQVTQTQRLKLKLILQITDHLLYTQYPSDFKILYFDVVWVYRLENLTNTTN